MTTYPVDAGPHQVSRAIEIDAPASELFDLIADPHRHRELDGSGTVRDTVSGPTRLSDGAKFSVKMNQYGLPYRITSRVTNFTDNQLIEWRHPLGHRWRWEFSPAADGRTRVTETFDYGVAGGPIKTRYYELFGFAKKNATGIESTLDKLQARYAGS